MQRPTKYLCETSRQPSSRSKRSEIRNLLPCSVHWSQHLRSYVPGWLPRGLGVLLGLALTGCETVVDVELPDQPARLVANGFLEAGQPVTVALSRSESILEKVNSRFVSGATLTLLEEGQAVATIEERESSGIYNSSFRPLTGRTYTLRATKEGFESVEAVTVIPPLVPIREVAYDSTLQRYSYDNGDSVVVEEYVQIDQVRITFDDPANERNYYEVVARTYEAYFEEVYDTDGNYVRTDTVFDYRSQYITSDDPVFSGEGGDFLGDEGEAYGEVLSFSDELLNGKTYTFQFDLNAYFGAQQTSPQVTVLLRSISEEQYRYFRSADLQYENDGNPFAEPVQVYSNVENGYGIFTGSSADSVVFEME